MFFFFHLLTGLILGLLVSDLLKDQRWFIPITLGAVLPDLIDKPVGYLLFPTIIGYGRIYSHILLIAIIILALGIVIWKVKKDPGVLGVGVGILSHQVLDMMWREPSNWYYPLFGPFKGKMGQDYFFTLLARDFSQPFEQVLALMLCAIVLAVICRHKLPAIINKNNPVFLVIASLCAFLLCILSGIIIGLGISRHNFPALGWSRPEELIISGIIIALAALLVWRWEKKARKELHPD